MRISDWSSDVCSSDLIGGTGPVIAVGADMGDCAAERRHAGHDDRIRRRAERNDLHLIAASRREGQISLYVKLCDPWTGRDTAARSEPDGPQCPAAGQIGREACRERE